MFPEPQPEVHANCSGALPETATGLPDPENQVTHYSILPSNLSELVLGNCSVFEVKMQQSYSRLKTWIGSLPATGTTSPSHRNSGLLLVAWTVFSR